MAISDYLPLSKDEIQPFMERSDFEGFKMVLWIWGSTAAVFALAVLFPYWYVYVAVVFLFAGRMQGIAAMMHEVGHYTLFETKKYNEFVRDWLSSPFIFMDGKAYSKFHMLHHKNAGTKNDPDLENYKNYPITKMSFLRKCFRDFSGWTGLKLIAYWLLTGKDAVSKEKRAPFTLTKGVLMNGVIFAALWFVGAPEVFALWILSHFTVYMFIVRFRQISEHGGVQDIYAMDPKYNTRSVPQGILGFLFFSPTSGLSYHCEHHAFMAVPSYHLKGLHEKLKEKGYYDDIQLHSGYLGVFKDIFIKSA